MGFISANSRGVMHQSLVIGALSVDTMFDGLAKMESLYYSSAICTFRLWQPICLFNMLTNTSNQEALTTSMIKSATMTLNIKYPNLMSNGSTYRTIPSIRGTIWSCTNASLCEPRWKLFVYSLPSVCYPRQNLEYCQRNQENNS